MVFLFCLPDDSFEKIQTNNRPVELSWPLAATAQPQRTISGLGVGR